MNQVQRKKEYVPPYIHEQFNVLAYYRQFTTGIRRCAAQIINSLIEALNECDHLLRYLIIVPDKDLISDIDVFEFRVSKVVSDVVQWMLKEINMFIR